MSALAAAEAPPLRLHWVPNRDRKADSVIAGVSSGPNHRASLFKPRRDEADLSITEANKPASRDEYRHVMSYGLFREAKKALTGEEQVAERLIYSHVFDPAEHERCANVIGGLLSALEDKRLEIKDNTAREKRERERREAEANNKNDKGDKGKRKANE
eukprot:jgi/Tetstr1/456917/TSEL_043587.t1